MSTAQLWNNLTAWTLQIALLVGIGAAIPLLLRLRMPRARLLFWQVLLAACLLLPWARPWKQEVVNADTQVSMVITTAPQPPSSSHLPPFREIALWLPGVALWLLAAGIAIRLIWLGVGLARLAAYRQRARAMAGTGAGDDAGVAAALLLSDEVTGPVTFGWRNPVVLLPACFPSLPGEMRNAILCHELLHVKRRDWLFTMGEELIRVVLWFHPAIWWVLGEIQLAREQTVDESVIEMTQARGSYVDALLAMAGAPAGYELAPAPMFLRKRHLKRRLMEVMREVRVATISKTHLFCLQTAAVVLAAAACWLAAGAFRMVAAPQVVADAAGVSVNAAGPLLHRPSVQYPADAKALGIEGTVVVQVKVDANGEVSDASVLSGPEALRKAVLQSVLGWHFEKSAALTTQVINISYLKPASVAAPAAPVFRAQSDDQKPMQQSGAAKSMLAPPPPPTSGKLNSISVTGLSDSARGELVSRLPVHVGEEWSARSFDAVRQAVREFDSHLTVSLGMTRAGELNLNISAPGSTLALPQTLAGPQLAEGVYRVGNGVAPPQVLSRVDPVYPEDARTDKAAGTVLLSVVIGTDGKAANIRVVNSPDLRFDSNAIDAVSQWIFRPGMKDGIPVSVQAQIEINFRML